jgi:hypothetical protein
MFTHLYTIVLLLCLFGCDITRAQVTIENPRNLPVDETRVNLLYTMASEEVARMFHVHDPKQLRPPLKLILGQGEELYTIDSRTGTIYLKDWNEAHFVGSVVMLAVHHLLSGEQFRVLVDRTLKRFSDVNPITVAEAKKHH